MEKDIPYKWKFLKSLATTFTSGKLDFKTKSIRKANKGIISVQFTSVSQLASAHPLALLSHRGVLSAQEPTGDHK